MQFLKKSFAFLLIFSFLSSVKNFTFGGLFGRGNQTPVDIAVFVAQDDQEVAMANEFLSVLCEAKKDRCEEYGLHEERFPLNECNFLRYKYGNCNEFNLNFDLLGLDPKNLIKSPNGMFCISTGLSDFLKNHPLALVLIDSRLDDIEWKELMEDYLILIKDYNKNASIVFMPFSVEDLIDINEELAKRKVNSMARYIKSNLEPILFSRFKWEKEQVLSLIPAMNKYIASGEFLEHVWDKLREMGKCGKLKNSQFRPTKVKPSSDERTFIQSQDSINKDQFGPQEGQVVLYNPEQNSFSQKIENESEKHYLWPHCFCLLL